MEADFILTKTDLTTFKTTRLLADLPEEKADSVTGYAISASGKTIALIFNEGDTFELFDTHTSKSLGTYPTDSNVLFYSETEILCFNAADMEKGVLLISF